MSIDATASALAAQEAVEAPQIETTETTPEMTEDSALDAIWQRHNAEEQPEDEAPDQPETAETEEVPEPEAPEIEVPSSLPSDLKNVWKDLPENARSAILSDREGLHRKLSDMGRQVQGIGPIRDVLIEATQKLPALNNMTPKQAADEIFQLAQMSNAFNEKPVETMLGLIKKHGLEQAMTQALSGQQVSQGAQDSGALKQEIATLKRQLAQFGDPEYLRQQVSQITGEERVLSEVEAFAGSAEHWQAVENDMPTFVQIARNKLGEGAAPKAVLETAYKMALRANELDTQATEPPAAEAKAKSDPARTKAAIQAKSVNVTGKATGKARTMTEDELLSAAYDRARQA